MKEIKKSVCLFCSLGCGLACRVVGREAVAIDYDRENPVNKGSLCPRGYYNFELLNHPARLTVPSVRGNPASFSEAFSFVRRELDLLDPGAVAIVVSPLASLEDGGAAAALAAKLKTRYLCVGGELADDDAGLGAAWRLAEDHPATLEDIENSDQLLIIGDVLTRSPVLSRRINAVKAKRGKITVVDPHRSHTAWFADKHLTLKPGMEAVFAAALVRMLSGAGEGELSDLANKIGLPIESLREVAADFSSAAAGTVIVVPSANKRRNDLLTYFVRVFAGLADKKWIVFYGGGNTIGLNALFNDQQPGRAHYYELAKKLKQGVIQGLILLGEDLSDLERFAPKLLIGSRFFPPKFKNGVCFPQASHLELEGSYLFSGSRNSRALPMVPAAGGRGIAALLAELFDLDVEAAKKQAAETAANMVGEIFDLGTVINEGTKLEPLPDYPVENVTHFAGNDLAKNFFWYRAKG
ncbi:MAG: molybdopterin-dependent oxidoreductase [Candidatus Margulisiibacteriota bacterium]|jgi:hypothetical protein